jgi:hypothetical protein
MDNSPRVTQCDLYAPLTSGPKQIESQKNEPSNPFAVAAPHYPRLSRQRKDAVHAHASMTDGSIGTRNGKILGDGDYVSVTAATAATALNQLVTTR